MTFFPFPSKADTEASLERVKKNVKRDMWEGNITSLKKSPCFLSSASIALSKIPPDVALDKGEKKTYQIYNSCNIFISYD